MTPAGDNWGGFGSEIYKSHVIDAAGFLTVRQPTDLWGSDPQVGLVGRKPSYDAARAQDAFFRITFSLTIVVLPWYVTPLSQATL